jgi:hypothetical protein
MCKKGDWSDSDYNGAEILGEKDTQNVAAEDRIGILGWSGHYYLYSLDMDVTPCTRSDPLRV